MNRPPQQPSIPPSCRPSMQPADSCCQRQYNCFLCWLALYEILMVIAHRFHIRVRQRWRENWLWKEYLEGRNWGHNCGFKETESYSGSSQRSLESVRITLARGQHCHQIDSNAKFGDQYMPQNGQIKIPFWQFAIHPGFLVQVQEKANGFLLKICKMSNYKSLIDHFSLMTETDITSYIDYCLYSLLLHNIAATKTTLYAANTT